MGIKSAKDTGRKSMKRLRDVKPPEWGTKEMADRYSKVIPGQPDDIGESTSGAAEAFIKDNKSKFKNAMAISGSRFSMRLRGRSMVRMSLLSKLALQLQDASVQDPYTVKYSKSKRGQFRPLWLTARRQRRNFLLMSRNRE